MGTNARRLHSIDRVTFHRAARSVTSQGAGLTKRRYLNFCVRAMPLDLML